GLALGRRFGPVVRARLISAVFGLLLVPSVRLHDVIDGALSGGSELGDHQHGGLDASTGVLGTLAHGLRDAAVGELAAVPVMLVALLLLERGTRDRRVQRWTRVALLTATAAVAAVLFSRIPPLSPPL